MRKIIASVALTLDGYHRAGCTGDRTNAALLSHFSPTPLRPGQTLNEDRSTGR